MRLNLMGIFIVSLVLNNIVLLKSFILILDIHNAHEKYLKTNIHIFPQKDF